MKYLDANGYAILWTVLGGKHVLGGRTHGEDWKGELIINGVAMLNGSDMKYHQSTLNRSS